MKIIFPVLCSIFLTINASAAPAINSQAVAKSFDLSTQESNVEFTAIGKPSLIRINGTGGKLKGSVSFANLIIAAEFIVPLDTVVTGVSLRDKHLKEKYLETDKFPEAILQITDLKTTTDFLNHEGAQKDLPFKGNLKIHGQESPVEGTADINSDQKNIFVHAQTKTNITAHKIDLPNYLGIKVADEVEIKVDFKIKK